MSTARSRRSFGVAATAALLIGVVTSAAAAIAEAGAPADDDGASATATSSEPAAVVLLMRAVKAQTTRTYSGTEYVCAWSRGSATSSVVNVDHRAGQGTYVEVEPSVAAPGGSVQEPERSDVVAPEDPLAVAAVDSGPLDLLRRNFALALGTATAATQQVLARRRDGTVAAAFWIDRRSDLLVRREIFDSAGRLARASAFVDLRLGAAATRTASASDAINVTATDETVLSDTDVAAMRAAGWVLPVQLPGGMVLYDVRRQGSGTGQVVHLSYSDGLSTVSVFVQRGRLVTSSVGRWSRQSMGGRVYVADNGLGTRVMWNGSGRVYTLVADAPPSTVDAVVASLPHGERQRGVWSRLRHGLDRVGSWFNPFS